MKKTVLATVVLLMGALAGATACSSSDQPADGVKASPVTNVNPVTTVTGDGRTATVNDANLSFGAGGRIQEVLVKEGDQVAAGQIIARLETDALELALAQAEVAYSQAQLTLGQNDLAVSQAAVAVTQAEINQKSAEIALEQTVKSSSVNDIRVAQADADTAKRNLADSLIVLSGYVPGSVGYEEYQKNLVLAQARLKAAQDRLDAMLGGFGSSEVALKQQQVAAAVQALAAARQSLEQAKLAADLGKQTAELAAKSRDYATQQLADATLVAPFGGTIARVPVDAGDTVAPTTVIAQLIDPRMEADVLVDEIDIPGVRTGQGAVVIVDAFPSANFTGTVSYVSPLPTTQGGVTQFEVRIQLDASDAGLKAGMTASADIVTSESLTLPVSVPPVPGRDVSQPVETGDGLYAR